jgi:3-hydroxyacyl-[acyl-carrier-protein] dehydratase
MTAGAAADSGARALRIAVPPRTGSAARGRGQLTAAELAGILPHRFPFTVLDAVEEIEPGVRATGVMLPSRSSWFFMGHFPDQPVLPGVLIIEAMAQLSGVVIWTGVVDGVLPGARAEQPVSLVSVKRICFRKVISPGTPVRLDAELAGHYAGISEFRVTARVGGCVAADGALQLGPGVWPGQS